MDKEFRSPLGMSMEWRGVEADEEWLWLMSWNRWEWDRACRCAAASATELREYLATVATTVAIQGSRWVVGN